MPSEIHFGGWRSCSRSIQCLNRSINVVRFTAAASELRPFFWTSSLLTLCCHFPSHIFKSLYRCLVSDAGMPTLPVVENLDVFKGSNLSLRARFKAQAVHQFFFQRSKEAKMVLVFRPVCSLVKMDQSFILCC